MTRTRIALLAGVALLIEACASTPTVTTAASDANLIATGVAAAIAAIQASPSLTAGQQASLAQIQGYSNTIATDAAAIAANGSASAAQDIETVVSDLAPIALSLIPGDATVIDIIQAALSLAPQVLADLGVTATSVKAGAVAPSATMPPDVARSKLRADVVVLGRK
jgi:hypothetical protein